MSATQWTQADTDRAQQIWREYESLHDLSQQVGQTAGIDPASGRIWFGDSIQKVVALRDAAGSTAPLFFVRVGSQAYFRKGVRR